MFLKCLNLSYRLTIVQTSVILIRLFANNMHTLWPIPKLHSLQHEVFHFSHCTVVKLYYQHIHRVRLVKLHRIEEHNNTENFVGSALIEGTQRQHPNNGR